MNKTKIAIGVLTASNIATAALAWHYRQQPEIYVDHLEDLRLSVESDGLLRARLGDSRTQSAVHVAFTPHGAIQLQHELGRMFAVINDEAAKQRGGQSPAKPGQSL